MIELFDGWWIDVDSQSYTLKRTVAGTSKKGDPITRDEVYGYYSTLESTLKALGKEMVREGLIDGTYSLTDALNMVSDARKKVEDLIHSVASV